LPRVVAQIESGGQEVPQLFLYWLSIWPDLFSTVYQAGQNFVPGCLVGQMFFFLPNSHRALPKSQMPKWYWDWISYIYYMPTIWWHKIWSL
jgi:hypothetical protein